MPFDIYISIFKPANFFFFLFGKKAKNSKIQWNDWLLTLLFFDLSTFILAVLKTYFYYHIIPCKFFIPVLSSSLSMESGTASLLRSLRTLQTCVVDLITAVVWLVSILLDFHFLQSFFQAFWDRFKRLNNNLYYCHHHVLLFCFGFFFVFSFSSKLRVLVSLFAFFYFQSVVSWIGKIHSVTISFFFLWINTWSNIKTGIRWSIRLFCCLMSLQPSWVIQCRNHPSRWTVVILFNPSLGR